MRNIDNLLSTANPINNRQFLTKEQDNSGLIYFGARYYDPKIGRFITPDPMGMIDGPNTYLYCNNDPINLVDLWGLCKEGISPSDAIFIIKQYLNGINKLSPQLRVISDITSSFFLNKGLLETLSGIVGGTLGGAIGGTIGSAEGPLGTFVFGAIGSYSLGKQAGGYGAIADQYYNAQWDWWPVRRDAE